MNQPILLPVGLQPLNAQPILRRASSRDSPPQPLYPLIFEEVNSETSLVGRVFSTSIFDKEYIKYALKYRWGPRIKFKISLISENLFLVDFHQKEHVALILAYRPWQVYGDAFPMCPIFSDGLIERDALKYISVWVQLINL